MKVAAACQRLRHDPRRYARLRQLCIPRATHGTPVRNFFSFGKEERANERGGRRGASVPPRPPMAPGHVSPRRALPANSPVVKPNYADTGKLPPPSPSILLHTPESIEKMRAAGRLARKMLDYTCSLVRPGITTEEIDRRVHDAILASGAYPSPLNYWGFPKSICSSINEVVIHGIPDDRPLQEGDIAKFDISLYFQGVHGDNCASVGVGEVDAEGLRLMTAAKEALQAGIDACGPGACLSGIGSAVHAVADKYEYETVRAYSGHGVGPDLHMRPFVLHYRNGERLPLRPGMIFTIEPMLLEHGPEITTWADGWTVVSKDGGRGAQFEHTVLITEDGVEVLTLPE